MRGSFHYMDRAIDLDTEGDVWDDLLRLFMFLRRHLQEPYQVILEKDHIHVEVGN